MSNNFVFPEWLSSNSVRAYPLSQAATRRDLSDTIQLPDSLIVSAAINTLPDGYVDGRFFISRLISLPDQVILDLSFEEAGGAIRLISRITVPGLTHQENTPYAILGTGVDSSVTGSIVVGNLLATQSELAGSFDFSPNSTPFETDCLFFSVPAVKYLEFYNGPDLVGRFTNVVRLRAGRNIRFRMIDPDGDILAVDAIDGLNTVSPDACEKLPELRPPIRTINMVGPDVDGNFNLEGSDCIALDTIVNGQSIRDICSQSCCGCDELAALVEAQKQVEAQLVSLREQVQAVRTNQTEMIVNLVAGLS